MLPAVAMQAADTFLGHPAVQGAVAAEKGVRLDGSLNLTLEGQVEAELEGIFCRGSEWETGGVEHVFLLQALPQSAARTCTCCSITQPQ